ncbi:hypothetical protein [Opitutus sp. ER46]|uniref:hypothetical protein n=1 Tax=Opitutus sp. ER46 TaxID=2161864 RepID=UPI000D32374F|nr:hypothetical protein [Opitutus sp. ER46]PTX94586.1 hypothetical protein DB354_12705 [Opitutus sp. ER46]
MKLSKLLATRQALLRQTQLANLAYAYVTLRCFVTRIANANLHGLVRLRPADPDDGCYWATLTALDFNQSVVEEHFGDQELIQLADAVAFATDTDFAEVEFRLEEMGDRFLQPLHETLEEAGITLDHEQGSPNVSADNAD